MQYLPLTYYMERIKPFVFHSESRERDRERENRARWEIYGWEGGRALLTVCIHFTYVRFIRASETCKSHDLCYADPRCKSKITFVTDLINSYTNSCLTRSQISYVLEINFTHCVILFGLEKLSI